VRSTTALVALLVALACGRARSREAMPGAAVVAIAVPDSLVDTDVVYRGRVTVVTIGEGSTLDVRVDLRNLRPDSVTVESEAGNCNPPLYLRPAAGGRWVAWNDAAWEAQTTPQPDGSVSCVGAGVLVRMAAGGRGRLVPRVYLVSAIRGDSLPPGLYDLAVGVWVERATRTSTGFIKRQDTLRVPAGRVTLP
jgi:hypothetical protein